MKTILKGTMGTAAVVVVVVVVALSFVQPAYAEAFSDLSTESQAIVNQVKADTDANTACKSKDTLETAVKTAVQELLKAGTLTGKPRDQAYDAGKYMYLNCGSV